MGTDLAVLGDEAELVHGGGELELVPGVLELVHGGGVPKLAPGGALVLVGDEPDLVHGGVLVLETELLHGVDVSELVRWRRVGCPTADSGT